MSIELLRAKIKYHSARTHLEQQEVTFWLFQLIDLNKEIKALEREIKRLKSG